MKIAATLLIALLLFGCNQNANQPAPATVQIKPMAVENPESTFADLLTIYEAEQKELDRIQAEEAALKEKMQIEAEQIAAKQAAFLQDWTDRQKAASFTETDNKQFEDEMLTSQASVKLLFEQQTTELKSLQAMLIVQITRVKSARDAKDAARP